MSTVTISDRLSKTLKEFLIPEFQDNFYLLAQHPMLRYLGMEVNEADRGSGAKQMPRVERLAQTERVNSGYKFQIAHNHTPFGGGTYAQKIGASLRPGKFQGDRSSGLVKFITQSMQIPAQVMEASRSPEFSIVNEVVQNMRGAAHSMHWEMNRMMLQDSNHALCYVNGAVNSSASFTVQTCVAGTNETPATQHLQAGDVLWIGTTNQIQAGTAQTVTVLTVTGDTTFTATAPETCSDNDVVVRADVYDVAGAAYTDVTPLSALITNTGTVQGLNKANYKWFQSYLNSNVTTLAESHIKTMVSATRRFSKSPAACFLIGNQKQWDRYSALLTSTKYYNSDTFAGNLAGGVEGLAVYTPDGSLPFFIDDMMPDGVIYKVDPSSFKWFNFRDFGPANDALGVEGYAAQRMPNTLDYEFALWMGGEIGQTNAQASGQLAGITA